MGGQRGVGRQEPGRGQAGWVRKPAVSERIEQLELDYAAAAAVI